MMTRHAFNLLSVAIAQIESLDSRAAAFNAVSEACRASNPMFKRELFKKACNVTTVSITDNRNTGKIFNF